MPARLPFTLLLATLPLLAEQPLDTTAKAPPTPPAVLLMPPLPGAPTSWLGVDLAKPDSTLTAQLPSLPAGIGFVIKTVHSPGPAADAGLQLADLIWKFDDQLIVNEAQLSALLRLRQPGDEVLLSLFRGGSPLEISVKLGPSPAPIHGAADRAAEEVALLSENSPMRIVNLANQEAYFANAQGRASVRKIPGGYWLSIEDAEGKTIFNDRFDRSDDKCAANDSIPKEWKRRAYALRRGLDHAIEGGIVPPRQLRPRVVPPGS